MKVFNKHVIYLTDKWKYIRNYNFRYYFLLSGQVGFRFQIFGVDAHIDDNDSKVNYIFNNSHSSCLFSI